MRTRIYIIRINVVAKKCSSLHGKPASVNWDLPIPHSGRHRHQQLPISKRKKTVTSPRSLMHTHLASYVPSVAVWILGVRDLIDYGD